MCSRRPCFWSPAQLPCLPILTVSVDLSCEVWPGGATQPQATPGPLLRRALPLKCSSGGRAWLGTPGVVRDRVYWGPVMTVCLEVQKWHSPGCQACRQLLKCPQTWLCQPASCKPRAGSWGCASECGPVDTVCALCSCMPAIIRAHQVCFLGAVPSCLRLQFRRGDDSSSQAMSAVILLAKHIEDERGIRSGPW